MLLIHLFLSLIFLLATPYQAFAQTIENYTTHFRKEVYFDFSIDTSWLLDYDFTKYLNFHYKIPDEYLNRFVVKPFSSGGRIYIFDNATYINPDLDETINFWISENSMWSEFLSLDQLDQKILIKLEGNFHDVDVWFEVLDKKTGKIYKTPKHTFWNYSILEKNFDVLNKNILKKTLSNAKIPL